MSSPRASLLLLACAASLLAACRSCGRPVPRPRADAARAADGALLGEEAEEPEAPPPSADAGPTLARCERRDERWFVPVRDGGAVLAPDFDGAALLQEGDAWWAAWRDRRDGAVRVLRDGREPASLTAQGGALSGPVLVPLGARGVVLASFEPSGRGLREHQVWQFEAQGEPVRLFAQGERVGEGVSVAAARLGPGVVIAWEEGRGDQGSAVLGQVFTPAATPRALATPPASRMLTPPEHDASDPVLVPRADGSAVLLWLAAQDVDAEESNQTSTELWARALSPTGALAGQPMRLTPRPAARFAVVARRVGETLWVTYRVEGDADVESRGDGGSVAVLRVGPDLAPLASAELVTGRGSVPTGEASVLPAGSGVHVWWAERGSEGLRTMRRAVDASGRPQGEPQLEPELHGEVPTAGDAQEPWVLAHGPAGEPGLARYRCPAPGVVRGAAPRRDAGAR